MKASILAEANPRMGLNMKIESPKHQIYAYLKSCLCKYEYTLMYKIITGYNVDFSPFQLNKNI
jgi:hypothetical protein